jgi:hypothetical protein
MITASWHLAFPLLIFLAWGNCKLFVPNIEDGSSIPLWKVYFKSNISYNYVFACYCAKCLDKRRAMTIIGKNSGNIWNEILLATSRSICAK